MEVDEQDQEDEQEMLEGAVGGAAAGSGAVGGALVPKKRFEVKKVVIGIILYSIRNQALFVC